MKRYTLLTFSFFILYFSFSIAMAQTLEKIGAAINTEYNEQHPLISPDGKTLYFIRVSHPSNNFGEKGSHDVWYSDLRENGDWTIARRMPNTINKDQYNDIFSITPDGNSMLISGVYINGKRENEVGFSICKRTKTGWSEPQKVVMPKFDDLCKGQFLSGYLSNDGRTLLLAFSEKRNSKEDDIYVTFSDKTGHWTKPESLGPDINTSDTETTPFLASDGYTLYFATNRKGGLGGTDIWVSKRLDRTWRRWSKPVNMGDKINTDADEFSYSIAASGEYAYMSTKKSTVGKGDIIRFKLRENNKPAATLASIVNINTDKADAETDNGNNIKKDNSDSQVNVNTTDPGAVVMLSGRVIDQKTGKPIEAKMVYQTLPDGEEVGVAYTNPLTGEYKIVLPVGKKYSFRAEAPNFLSVPENIDLTKVTEYREISGKDLKIVPIEVGSAFVMNNIFFAFGKATLRTESFPELDRVLSVMNENKNMVIEIRGHTDNVGSNEANQKLSQDRADAVRTYLINKKLAANRITSVGFGETKPVADNATEEGMQRNRRVELVIVKN